MRVLDDQRGAGRFRQRSVSVCTLPCPMRNHHSCVQSIIVIVVDEHGRDTGAEMSSSR